MADLPADLQPIPDFARFVQHLVAEKGYGLNRCPDHCPDRGSEHAHLRSREDDGDFIAWADGRVSGYDLTQPAALLFPAPQNAPWIPGGAVSDCYRMGNGSMVHVRPGCRCPR